jgi:hypothetical protein
MTVITIAAAGFGYQHGECPEKGWGVLLKNHSSSIRKKVEE